MYLCTNMNIKCPYALSPNAPRKEYVKLLKCTANWEQCKEYVKLLKSIKEQYPNEPHYACNCQKIFNCPYAISSQYNTLTICTLLNHQYCEHQAIRQPLPKPTQNNIKIPINPILILQLED